MVFPEGLERFATVTAIPDKEDTDVGDKEMTDVRDREDDTRGCTGGGGTGKMIFVTPSSLLLALPTLPET